MANENSVNKRCFRYLTVKTKDEVINILEAVRPRRWSVAICDGKYVVFMETRKKEIVNM